MATMHVELVSIEAPIWEGEATAVFARTVEGQLGILPGHTPLLGALAPGYPVRIDREDGESLHVAVHGGFLSVSKEGVSVLAEQAELAEDIDVERARQVLSRTDEDGSPDEEAARNRALARLRASGETV
ncbi:MAG: F-type H+-transporting ATPase subunit epsilon [Pseudonocardiales bacterium]|jgi:F-type H+-transporting ATPase subunit epsilon|nr:F-type H+-transporting ATPase subunit epsilon [Pseudonocardiales bacterium]